MPQRTTIMRSLHDLGLAAWFGGSLMGAAGLNTAAATVTDRSERLTVANAGWTRWAPINAAAIGAHMLGGLGILVAERNRVRHQQGVGGSTLAKTTVTAAALGVAAYSGLLNRRARRYEGAPVEGSVVPASDTPGPLAHAQQGLRRCQWATPALTGSLVLLAALQSEQQRPLQQLGGIARQSVQRLNLST